MKSVLGNSANILHDAKCLCVFGVGVLFQDCFEQIVLLLRRKPDYLSDNSSDKWGKEFNGVKCIPPRELIQTDENIVVVIAVREYHPICFQLESLGVNNIFLLSFSRGYSHISNFRAINGSYLNQITPEQKISIKGRWALVTGASRGIGYQIALALAGMGVNIIAHSRSESHAARVVEACGNLGVGAYPVSAEFADMASVKRLLQGFGDKPIDLLFNCAGISIPLPGHNRWDLQDDIYLKTYAVNTVAPIMLCNHLLPLMMARGFGRVVNISSSIQYRPGEMAYACSKAALDKYVYDICPTLQNSGVLISIVDPGWLKTDMGGSDAPHAVESVIPGALLGAVLDDYKNGQWFSAQDYANLSLDLAIRKAKFVTQQYECQ